MKRLIIIFIVLLVSTLSLASETPRANFLERWNISKRTQGEYPDGREYHVQLLQRLIGIHGRVYPVASVSVLWQEAGAKSDRLNRPELLRNLKLGYGIDQWMIERDGNNDVYSAKLPDQSRMLRLYIAETKRGLMVSTATYRLGYADAVASEVAVVQAAWSKQYADKKKISLFSSMVTPAFAAGFDYGNLLDSIDPGSLVKGQGAITSVVSGSGLDANVNVNVNGKVDVSGNVNANVTGSLNQNQYNQIDRQLTNINTNVDRANTGIDKANQNWDNTNTQIDKANQNWSDTNKQVDVANQNWANTNTQVDKANANWSETNRVVDKNWADTNKQLSRANDIAEKMSDPKHMFMLSGATAAGAVFGASAANLAIEGMKMGLEWIIEQITDSKGKANRWALFAEARKNWDDTIRHALSLERSIDNFLGHYQLLQDLKKKFPGQKINIEDILRHFSKEIVKEKKVLAKYQKNFDSATDARCEDEWAEKIVGQENLVKEMEDISAILTGHLKDNPGYDIFDERFFCSKMGEMMRNLLDAENTLQEYRIFMIDGKAEFADQIGARGEKLYDKAERYNDKRSSLAKREKEVVEENYERALAQLKETASANCKRADVSFFSSSSCVEEQLGTATFKRKLEALKKDKEQALSKIGRGYDDQTENYLTVNQNTINQKMALYQDWFKELEEQQFCSQNPDDRGCQELSKFKYNGHFAIKDKAVDSMAQICPNQDMNLVDVNRKAADAEIASIIGETNKNFRAPAYQSGTKSAKASAPSDPSSGGFFSSLFSSVKNFFSSIADGISSFFSSFGSKSVGEERAVAIERDYIPPTQVGVVDNYRAPAVVAKSVAESIEAKDLLKNKYPEAYVALMRAYPSAGTMHFEKLWRTLESGLNSNGLINIQEVKKRDTADAYKLLIDELFAAKD